MPDVFVSYSRSDQAFVRELAGRLADRGKDVWVDWEDIPPTADWLARIKAGIEESNAFVFVISPASVTSVVCGQEVAHATAVGKRIVPVLLQPVDPAETPGRVSAHNWISFVDDPEPAFETLVAAIETDLPWLEEHTRWLGRAREWEQHERDASFLLRGSELAAAEAWLAQAQGADRDPPPTPLQYEHITASRRAATRRARTLMVAVSAALVVAVVLAVVALVQRAQAIDQRERATARALLANSALNLDTDPELSVALAAQAVGVRGGAEGEQALRRALSLSFVRETIHAGGRPDRVALTPDASRVLAGGVADGAARLFDVRSGRALARFAGVGSEDGAALSPDGTCVLTVGGETDPQVRIADAVSGRVLAHMAGGPPGITRAAWSPDGTRVVTSASDGAARVWDAASGRLLAKLGRGPALVNADWAPDGQHVVTGDGAGTITVWDVGRRRAVLRRSVGQPAEVHVTPDGSKLVALGQEGTATVLATATGARLAVLPGTPSIADAVALSPDGRYALSAGGSHGLAVLWRLRDGKRVAVLGEASGGGAAISADGTLGAAAAPDGSVRIWSLPDGRQVAALRGQREGTEAIAFAARADRLASLDGAGDVRVWQPGPAAAGGGRPLGVPGRRVTVAVGTRGQRVLLGADDGSATLVDGRGDRQFTSDGFTRQVFDAAFAADGSRFAAGGADVARLVDARTGRTVTQIDDGSFFKEVGTDAHGRLLLARWEDGSVTARRPGGPVEQLATGAEDAAVSPQGDRVAVVGRHEMAILRARDGAVLARAALPAKGQTNGAAVTWGPRGLLLVTANGEPYLVDERLRVVHALPGGTADVIAGDGAFSADGRLVALGVPPGTRVWRTADGSEVARLDQQDMLGEPQFSADGRFLLTGTDAATAQVWDVAAGTPLTAARGDFPRWIPGTTDFTTVDDGVARVWSCEECASGAALLRLADARVTRPLTADERRRYLEDH